jgi:hypothetical protein
MGRVAGGGGGGGTHILDHNEDIGDEDEDEGNER